MKEEYIECYANKKVEGIIRLSGSKNASLPIVICSLLCKDKSVFHNVPNISDIQNLLNIFVELGVISSFKDNDLIIDSSSLEYRDLIMEEVSSFRASYYLIPVLLFYVDEVRIRNIGGCSFEKRPIDIHIDVLTSFGITHKLENGINVFKKNRLHGCNYRFKKKSVGASINAIILASFVLEETRLYNYSHEIEVLEVIDTLIQMGVSISIHDEYIKIIGIRKYRSIERTIPFDRIEGETFMLFALSYGRMIISGVNKKHYMPFISFLDEIEAKYEFGFDVAYFQKKEVHKSMVLSFANEEKLSTDIGSLIMIYLLLNSTKLSLFNDEIYKKRILFMNEFNECVFIRNNRIIINPRNLNKKRHFHLKGNSLRETMAFVLYAFIDNEKKIIEGKKYLDRGYEDIVNKLISINGKVNVYEK